MRDPVGLLPWNCGCDARRDIMFTRGGLGAPEAAIMALAVVALVVAITTKGGKPA